MCGKSVPNVEALWSRHGISSGAGKTGSLRQLAGSCFNRGFPPANPESPMPKQIRTESDISAPKPIPAPGFTLTRGKGQKRSLERGTATRSKKNPGKRPKQGG
jgi:hypothetical protein